jgi:4-aminobutyrate aminotransferase-like enzyme
MPHPSLDSFFFWNSGSEAVEAAIKLARFATKKTNIICFQGAYHGRTYGSTAVTKSKTVYFHGTGPVMVCVYRHSARMSRDEWKKRGRVEAASGVRRRAMAGASSYRPVHGWLDVVACVKS